MCKNDVSVYVPFLLSVQPPPKGGKTRELFGIPESLLIQLLDAQSGVPWLHYQAPCSGWTSWIDSACFGLLLISIDVDKSDTRRKWQLFWRVRPLRDFSAVRSLAAAAAASHEPSGVFVSSQDRTRWTSLHFCFLCVFDSSNHGRSHIFALAFAVDVLLVADFSSLSPSWVFSIQFVVTVIFICPHEHDGVLEPRVRV